MAHLPYGRHWIDEDDIQAVVRTLRSDWLTTGPAVDEFERAFAACTGARHAVAVANGTAALHAAMFALKIGPGDEVIVPPLTFAATANCVVYQGATPVFADVAPDTLLLDPERAAEKVTPRTKAIIAVDYAGQPCDYDALRTLAKAHGIAMVADACHSLGAIYKGRSTGTLADLTAFSFHPVKHITTCEGGMITTDNPDFARRMRIFRNHGITTDHRERAQAGSWFYEMTELGYNYRLSDVQCALGISQLVKLPASVRRRRQIAGQYDAAFQASGAVRPLRTRAEVAHAYHLYVVSVTGNRDTVLSKLRERGIGANGALCSCPFAPLLPGQAGTMPGRRRGLPPCRVVAYVSSVDGC
jgi:perosamine synthetase